MVVNVSPIPTSRINSIHPSTLILRDPDQAVQTKEQSDQNTDQHETQTNPSPRPSPTSHITNSILEGSGGNHGAFDELDDDAIDYMETEDAQDVGRTRYVVHEEKESAEKEVSTEDVLGTDKQKVSTDKEEVSTDRPDEGTINQNEGRSATQTAPTTTTPTIFGDDETIAQVLIIMSQNKEKLKEKEKGVELKDVEETERPRPTSTRSLLTLKPLPKIDLKDKGKKKISCSTKI
ncbi:hypothetical protein Tco_1553384 [Tanacetum coccineum]